MPLASVVVTPVRLSWRTIDDEVIQYTDVASVASDLVLASFGTSSMMAPPLAGLLRTAPAALQ